MPHNLLAIVSPRQGHFRLESGYHGSLWLDLDPLFLSPGRLQPFVADLANRLARHNIDAICGPLIGGAFLAQSIAAFLDLDFYYTERYLIPDANTTSASSLYPFGYRLPTSLRNSIQGKSVAIVDDAISAGSAIRGTFAALQSCGAIPACIGALLVLGSQTADYCASQNLPLEQLTHLNYNFWLPADCPLCASNVPLEDTGASET